jgi:two-component system, NarL family, response regulator LiaR
MASAQQGPDIAGRLLHWGGRAETVFDTLGATRRALAHSRSIVRRAITQWRRPRNERTRRLLSHMRIRRRSLAAAALLWAIIVLSIGVAHTSTPGSPEPTRVMIVDDHPLLRHGMKAALLMYPEFTVVAEAGSGEQAIAQLKDANPDIILMDLMMPGMGGVAAIRDIRRVRPNAKILVVSNYYEDGQLVKEALEEGAIGYKLKDENIDELVRAIRLACNGIASLAPAAAQALVTVTSSARKLGDDLTNREREVLALAARGLTNAGVAGELVISEKTVKFHVRNIRTKLRAKSRTEMVVEAWRRHLIPHSY